MQIIFDNAAASGEIFSGTLSYGIGQSEQMLAPGQVVKATVIFASHDTANVKLANGAVLKARLTDGVTLKEGDAVWLNIKANDGKSVVLQYVGNSDAGIKPAETTADILSTAGLPQTQLNLKMAALLKDSGLPVMPESIVQAGAMLKEYPDVSLNAALFAAENKIEPSRSNLSIIESVLSGDFKSDKLITRLFTILTGQSVFSNTESAASHTALLPGADIENTAVPNVATTGIFGQDAVAESSGKTILSATEGVTNNPPPLETGFESAQAVPEEPGGRIKEGVGFTQTGVLEYNAQKAAGRTPVTAEDSQREQSFQAGTDVTDKEPMQQLLKTGSGVTNKGQTQQLLKAAEQTLYARIGKRGDAQTLKEAGEQLLGRLETLKAYAKANGTMGTNAAFEADRLIGGLSLLESIDRYSYMQIPVLLGDRPSTLELYVFDKKKGVRKANPDSTTVMLVLDTENLGRIEVLAKIKKSSLSLRVRTRDEKTADYLRRRTTVLYNMISETGYRLSGVFFQAGEQEVTPMTAVKIVKQDDDLESRRINFCI